MKKKGFTLVELLAVIVIMSIIALITVPVVSYMIEQTRKSSFRASVYGLINTTKIYFAENSDNISMNDIINFTCNEEDGCISENNGLRFKGETPIAGNIILSSQDNILVEYVTNGRYCAWGTADHLMVERNCDDIDTTPPELNEDDFVLTSTTSEINVLMSNEFAHDDESEIVSYVVTLYRGTKKIDSKTLSTPQNLIFTKLNQNTEYDVEVTVKNKVGNVSKLRKSIKTKKIENPSITFINTPGQSENGYLRSQDVKIVYSGNNITSPEYFVKTTRTGISNLEVAESCGDGNVPSTCVAVESTKTLIPNTWYKVSSEIKITYNQSSDTTDTIYALTYDGTNYSGASTGTISKIDTTSPTITLKSTLSKTNQVTLFYSLEDNQSGAATPTCKYGTTNGTYDKTGVATGASCTLKNLNNNTTYYYQICVADKVGNETTCKTGSTKSETFTNPDIVFLDIPSNGPFNGYLKEQIVNVIFYNDNVVNPENYIKTTRASVIGSEVTKSCGTGTMPGTCTDITATKNLSANTWYKVGENISITYNQASSTTSTIYAITYDGTNYSGASTGTISKIDRTSPTVTLGTPTVRTNNATIPYTLADGESGVGNYSCKYGTTNGSYTSSTNTIDETNCSITGLKSNTTYYYQVCSSDKVGNTATCKTGNFQTPSPLNPSITFTNTPGTAVNGYLQKQVATVIYNNTNISSPQYFVKTTRGGISSLAVTQSCGTGTTPGACSNVTSTTTLAANTWYKVSGNVNVTYSSTATSTATIYAITYDGTNYSGAVSGTVSKIDATGPVLNLGTITKSTNSMTIPFSTSDNESGFKNVTCKYGTTSGSYTTNANSVSTTGCSITGLSQNTNYYYQICSADNLGNSTCKTGGIPTAALQDVKIAYTNNPTTVVNGYLRSQVVTIQFNNANVTSPQYFIKSQRTGTSNLALTQSCGTGTNPGACSNITSTTTLTANTWYKVSGNVALTYNTATSATAAVYGAIYDGTNLKTAAGTVSKIDATGPSVTLTAATAKTNNLTIPITTSDTETGVNTPTCKYSTTNGSYTTNASSVNTTACGIKGLKANTTYYYQVCVSNKVGISTCRTGSAKTSSITNPSIAFTNTPDAAVSGYLKKQVAKVTYSNANISSPQYFVKTTRQGTSSLAVTQACGTGTTPGACSNVTSTTTLAANTWYKVSGNVNVTYSSTATSTATIYAVTYDGTNLSGTVSGTVSKIDAMAPSVTLSTASSTINSITVPITSSDAASGLNSTTCKYSKTDGSYTTNANSVSNTSCKITGLSSGTKYYYQVCVKDKVGNQTCKTGAKTTARTYTLTLKKGDTLVQTEGGIKETNVTLSKSKDGPFAEGDTVKITITWKRVAKSGSYSPNSHEFTFTTSFNYTMPAKNVTLTFENGVTYYKSYELTKDCKIQDYEFTKTYTTPSKGYYVIGAVRGDQKTTSGQQLMYINDKAVSVAANEMYTGAANYAKGTKIKGYYKFGCTTGHDSTNSLYFKVIKVVES